MDVVFDPKPLADQIGDPRTGPEIRRIAGPLCAPQKLALQLSFAAGIETWRPPGSGLSLDRALPSFEKAGFPSAHRTAVDLQFSGDVDGLKPLFKQADGVQATIFELRRAAEWSHAQRLGHYLCFYQ